MRVKENNMESIEKGIKRMRKTLKEATLPKTVNPAVREMLRKPEVVELSVKESEIVAAHFDHHTRECHALGDKFCAMSHLRLWGMIFKKHPELRGRVWRIGFKEDFCTLTEVKDNVTTFGEGK